MVTFNSVSPVLPVQDLAAALARYERLGFTVQGYEGGDDYGYARRDEVWLHLSRIDHVHAEDSHVSVYFYVDDADALHEQWAEAGVEGRLNAPADTAYGLREGSYVDPDGNLLRYGSWLDRAT
jgi:catechol 2,3-dioxygenase-like lactoylglutathione lyase family enzyme